VRARTDQSLWAASFERGGGDALALQADVARAIVEKVRAKLQPAEKARLDSPARVDPAALEHFLRGRHHLNQMTDAHWRIAISEFGKSIEIAPAYAPAYVGLSDVYTLMSGEILPSREAMTRARGAALEALRLDPALASAHAALGLVYASYDYDWARAEASFRRGLEINPHEQTVLQNYGQMLHVNGRFDEALAMFRRAREQDPLAPYVSVQALWPLNQGRRYAEAIRGARAILAADSSLWFAHFILGQSLAFSGRQAEGTAELESAARLEQASIALAWLGWAYGTGGRRAEAKHVLATLERRAKTGVVQPYCFALVHVALGDREEALRWLERGADERTTEITFIKVDPAWDPIREEPRFVRLLAQLGLAPTPGAAPRGPQGG
jgi:tetratricopeptide (TPR) repeat protein